MSFNVGDKVITKLDMPPVPAGTHATVIDNTTPMFGYRVRFEGEWVPTHTAEEMPIAWEGFDNTCPVFAEELELVEAYTPEDGPAPVSEPVTESEEDAIAAALALASDDAHSLDHIVSYVGQLVMGYEAMRVMCIEQGAEMGEAIYEMVRNEAHATFHMLLDYKKEVESE